MGEAHDAVADGDDLGALGLGQRIVAGHRVRRSASVGWAIDAATARPRRAAGERPSSRAATSASSVTGSRSPGSRCSDPACERAGQLEREERVPARQLVHVMEHRA